MSLPIARAIQLREEASLAEEQGNLDRAEVLYVESREIFLQRGDMHLIDAAAIMNTIASMKANHNDPVGALQAAQESIQFLNSCTETSTNSQGDQTWFQAWNVIGSAHIQLENYAAAEQALRNVLKHASNMFGDTDERTQHIHHQLALLHQTKRS